MLCVFLDTNVFLHFPPASEIDWVKVCGGTVKLVVCMPVIHELDKHKNDPRRKERAARAFREIDAILDQDSAVRVSVGLEVLHREIPHAAFEDMLSPDSADD